MALFLLSAFTRLHLFKKTAGYDPHRDTGLFWTESALQYYYARMVAQGETLPEVDYRAQYPEGINVRAELTMVMELFAGYGFRLFRRFVPDVPFHVFLVHLICLYSSVCVVWVYLLAREVWRSRLAGLVSAAFYAVAIPALCRLIGNYNNEDFGLPLFLGGLYFFLHAQDRRAWPSAILSGLFFLLAVLSWHVSQFLLLAFAVFLCLHVLRGGKAAADRMRRPLLGVSIVLALGGLATPLLSIKLFAISPVMAIFYGLVSYALLWARPTRGPALVKLVPFALCLAGLWCYYRYGRQEYSHAYLLAPYKVLHLLKKPAAPSALPYVVRCMWLEDFNSPSWYFLFFAFSTYLPLGVCPFLARLWPSLGRRAKPAEAALAYFFLVSLALFLLMRRMHILCVPFLCIYIGRLVVARARWAKAVAAIVLVGAFAFELHKTVHLLEVTGYSELVNRFFPEESRLIPNWRRNHLSLLSWIKRETLPAEAFVARMGTSPVILAYAGRPIVVHSKYESSWSREKYRRFAHSLFGTEDEFLAYCRRHQARYFVYEANMALDYTPDSIRYLTDSLRLSRSSAAYQFHFEPAQLRHFSLVYQNPHYRVFKVRDRPLAASATRPAIPYQPIFDLELFEGDGDPAAAVFNDGNTARVMHRLSEGVRHYDRSAALAAAQPTREAIPAMQAAIALHPGLIGAHTRLGLMYFERGRTEEALSMCQAAVAIHPHEALGRYNLGFIYQKLGRHADALKEMQEASRLAPDHEGIRKSLREIRSSLAGERRDAPQ